MFTRGTVRITPGEINPIPYKGPWEKLYSFCRRMNADRIRLWASSPDKVPPKFYYADAPGVRLVPLHYCRDNDDPELNYDRNNEVDRGLGVYRDGYIWCGTSYTKDDSGRITILPEGAHWGSMKHIFGTVTHLEVIRLQFANFVYVVDDAAYWKAIEQGRDAAFLARAETMVPISEYKGSYVSPFVVICRDLMFGEIETVENIHIEP